MTQPQRTIRFSTPTIGEEEIAEVVDSLRSNWITTGPKVQRFGTEFAEMVGAPGALPLASCTAASHVALAAAGIGPGDAVLTTTNTFVSTAHVIEQVGATPILLDTDPETMNLDPATIEPAIAAAKAKGLRPAGIVPVHFAGQPCEMDQILELCAQHDLFCLEDAAHALLAHYRGVTIGNVDHPSVRRAVAFSFYATKNVTTGEGGMLTGSPDFIEAAKPWSLHGMGRDAWKRYGTRGGWHYDVTMAGFKYNMTDIQAAIGIHQLKRIPGIQARRREIVARYTAGLADVGAIETPMARPHVDHAWHLYVARLNLDQLTIDRDKFIIELEDRGIGVSVHFIPVHLHQYYAERYGYAPGDLPVAWREYNRMVTLPLYPAMEDADVDYVIETVRDIAANYAR